MSKKSAVGYKPVYLKPAPPVFIDWLVNEWDSISIETEMRLARSSLFDGHGHRSPVLLALAIILMTALVKAQTFVTETESYQMSCLSNYRYIVADKRTDGNIISNNGRFDSSLPDHPYSYGWTLCFGSKTDDPTSGCGLYSSADAAYRQLYTSRLLNTTNDRYALPSELNSFINKPVRICLQDSSYSGRCMSHSPQQSEIRFETYVSGVAKFWWMLIPKAGGSFILKNLAINKNIKWDYVHYSDDDFESTGTFSDGTDLDSQFFVQRARGFTNGYYLVNRRFCSAVRYSDGANDYVDFERGRSKEGRVFFSLQGTVPSDIVNSYPDYVVSPPTGLTAAVLYDRCTWQNSWGDGNLDTPVKMYNKNGNLQLRRRGADGKEYEYALNAAIPVSDSKGIVFIAQDNNLISAQQPVATSSTLNLLWGLNWLVNSGSVPGFIVNPGEYFAPGSENKFCYCKKGTCWQDGTSFCLSCPAGEYSDVDETTASHSTDAYFKKCAGLSPKTKTDVAPAGSCKQCPIGKYGTKIGATSSSVCQTCPSGYYSDAPGSTSCKPCSGDVKNLGHFVNSGGLKNTCVCVAGWAGDQCDLRECPATLPGVSLLGLLFNADQDLRNYAKSYTSAKVAEVQQWVLDTLQQDVDLNGNDEVTKQEVIDALEARSIVAPSISNLPVWCNAVNLKVRTCYSSSVKIDVVIADAMNNHKTSTEHLVDGSGVAQVTRMSATYPIPSWTDEQCQSFDHGYNKRTAQNVTASWATSSPPSGWRVWRTCGYINGFRSPEFTTDAILLGQQKTFTDNAAITATNKYRRVYCIAMHFAQNCATSDLECENASDNEIKSECTVGLFYDGTPVDLRPMLTKNGIMFSYLDTSSAEIEFDIFVGSQDSPNESKALVVGIPYASSGCGRVSDHISFTDKENSNYVGQVMEYGIRALQLFNETSVNSAMTVARYRVPYLTFVQGTVKTRSGAGVPDVIVSYCRIDPDTGLNDERPEFCPLRQFVTDRRGQFSGELRVSDVLWVNAIEYFNVTAEKVETLVDGDTIVHEFEYTTPIVSLSHLKDGIGVSIVDNTSVTIWGNVAFDPNLVNTNCPFKKVPVYMVDAAGTLSTTESEPNGDFNFTITRGTSVEVYIPEYGGHKWRSQVETLENRATRRDRRSRRRLISTMAAVPSFAPTKSPTLSPTFTTTKVPTRTPTVAPSLSPSVAPSIRAPSISPTVAPSIAPTRAPTVLPTAVPTASPSFATPSNAPSGIPTVAPSTSSPTRSPSTSPSKAPTAVPTISPSLAPSSATPTQQPTEIPTMSPSFSVLPSQFSSVSPSLSPSQSPTRSPTTIPTVAPSIQPSFKPTSASPSRAPSTVRPSLAPSRSPTAKPSTRTPTERPTTAMPTLSPTLRPTVMPTRRPTTAQPSVSLRPTASPSISLNPTRRPTISPTRKPTTSSPTVKPTMTPSVSPTFRPTTRSPTVTPTAMPSFYLSSKALLLDDPQLILQFQFEDAQSDGSTPDTLYRQDALLKGSVEVANGALRFSAPTTSSAQKPFVQLPLRSVSPGSAFSVELWTSLDATNNDAAVLFSFGTPDNSADARCSTTATGLKGLVKAHVVVVCVKGKATIYVNGKSDRTETVATTTATSITHDFIGRGPGTQNTYLVGDIEEFRVWYGAMSADEVMSNYVTGFDQSHVKIDKSLTLGEVRLNFFATTKQNLVLKMLGGLKDGVPMFGPETVFSIKATDDQCAFNGTVRLRESMASGLWPAMNYTVTLAQGAVTPKFTASQCVPGSAVSCKCDVDSRATVRDYFRDASQLSQDIVIVVANSSDYVVTYLYRSPVCLMVEEAEGFSLVQGELNTTATPRQMCMPSSAKVLEKGASVNWKFKVFERYPVGSAWRSTGAVGDDYVVNFNVGDDVVIRLMDLVSNSPAPQEFEYNSTLTKRTAQSLVANEPAGVKYLVKAGSPNPSDFYDWELTAYAIRYGPTRSSVERTWYIPVVGALPKKVPNIYPVTTDSDMIFMVLRDPPGGGSQTIIHAGTSMQFVMSVDGMTTDEGSVGGKLEVELGEEVEAGTFVGIGGGATAKLMEEEAYAKFGFGYTFSGSTERVDSQSYAFTFTFEYDFATSLDPFIAGHPSDVIVGGGVDLIVSEAIEVKRVAKPPAGKVCFAVNSAYMWQPGRVNTYALPVIEIESTIGQLTYIIDDTTAEGITPAIRDQLKAQRSNWEAVLSNYREHNEDLMNVGMLTDVDRQWGAVVAKMQDASSDDVVGAIERYLGGMEKGKVEDNEEFGSLQSFSSSFGNMQEVCADKTLRATAEGMEACGNFDRRTWAHVASVLMSVCNQADSLDSANTMAQSSRQIERLCREGSVDGKKVPGGLSGAQQQSQSLFGFLSDSNKVLTYSANAPVTFAWTTSSADGTTSTTSDMQSHGTEDEGGFDFDLKALAKVGFNFGISGAYQHVVTKGGSTGSEQGSERTITVVLDDADEGDYFAIRVTEDPSFGTPVFHTVGGKSKCPGETGTSARESGVSIVQIKPRCGPNRDEECLDLAAGEPAHFGVVIQNLSPTRDTATYTVGLSASYDTYYATGYGASGSGRCGSEGMRAGLVAEFMETEIADIPYTVGRESIEVPFVVTSSGLCDQYKHIAVTITCACEASSPSSHVYQYDVLYDPASNQMTTLYDSVLGASESTQYFDVSWRPASAAAPSSARRLGEESEEIEIELQRQLDVLKMQVVALVVVGFFCVVAVFGMLMHWMWSQTKAARLLAEVKVVEKFTLA